MGHRCLGRAVCAWPEVCVCFLLVMASNSLLQLDGAHWLSVGRDGTSPPPTVRLSSGWNRVKNLIMIFMTGILWIYIEQAWHFFFHLYSFLYPSNASDLPQQSRHLKLWRLRLLCRVLKVLMWQVEQSCRGVMWLHYTVQNLPIRHLPHPCFPFSSRTPASSPYWRHFAELPFVEC